MHRLLQSEMAFIEVCICGHPVSGHEMAGTEYARCKKHPWNCYCSNSGGIRVALVVEESIENPTGPQTNGRFFRKTFHAYGEHPLNKSYERVKEEGLNFRWVVEYCDECGEDYPEFIAVVADLEGRPVIGSGSMLFTGRSALLCEPCFNLVRVFRDEY